MTCVCMSKIASNTVIVMFLSSQNDSNAGLDLLQHTAAALRLEQPWQFEKRLETVVLMPPANHQVQLETQLLKAPCPLGHQCLQTCMR